MTVFPKGKHDDQIDSTAQFLDWFKTPMPHWGIFEATRRMAEKLNPEPIIPVCMGLADAIGQGPKVRFALDSPLEERGFELSVPLGLEETCLKAA